MSGNVRLKALLLVVVTLAVIWFVGQRFGMRAKERTFHDVVMALDTAQVHAIAIQARRAGRVPYRLLRTGNTWTLQSPADTFRVERKAMLDLLAPLGDLRVKREVGTMDLVKDRYDLTDTLCEELTIELANGELRSLLVGKSTFSPKDAWSHVNVPGEREVFAISGKLSMATEMTVEEWRPRTVVKGDPRRWTRVHFQFPGNDYTFVRENGSWTLDGGLADTTRVRKYLESLATSEAHTVAHDVDTTGLPIIARLEIQDTARPAPIQVLLRSTADGRFLLWSTENPDNLLWFDAQREVPRLFRERQNWLPGATPSGPAY